MSVPICTKFGSKIENNIEKKHNFCQKYGKFEYLLYSLLTFTLERGYQTAKFKKVSPQGVLRPNFMFVAWIVKCKR